MKRIHDIEKETPILPHVVAERVIDEVVSWLEKHGHKEACERLWNSSQNASDFLTGYISAVYQHNIKFRKEMLHIQQIDPVYVWMEHWFASWLIQNDKRTFDLLPRGYGWDRRLN